MWMCQALVSLGTTARPIRLVQPAPVEPVEAMLAKGPGVPVAALCRMRLQTVW